MVGNFAHRLQLLQAQLTPQQALLLSDPADVAYFTGVYNLVPGEREALVVVCKAASYLLHASFAPLPPPSQTPYLNRRERCQPPYLAQHLTEISRAHPQLASLALDEKTLSVHEWRSIPKTWQQVPLDRNVIWQLRQQKDAEEVQILRRAAEITSTVMKAALSYVHAHAPGQGAPLTEQDLQRWINRELIHLGADEPAFPTIVAFGAHTAIPHHQPTTQILEPNTPVLLDFGARRDHYCSDMTRTTWYGPTPDPKFVEVAGVVKQAAHQAAAHLSAPHSKEHQPLSAASVDTAARSVIQAAGYGEYFIHTTGHGLGLDIHEIPSLGPRSADLLVKHAVVTIEPGIYLPNQFGYRYEDTVLVTPNGCTTLTVCTEA